MGVTHFRELQAEVFRLHSERRYADALALLERSQAITLNGSVTFCSGGLPGGSDGRHRWSSTFLGGCWPRSLVVGEYAHGRS